MDMAGCHVDCRLSGQLLIADVCSAPELRSLLHLTLLPPRHHSPYVQF